MAQIKTRPTGDDVRTFLEAVPDARRRAEGFELLALMSSVTGVDAEMWGPSIVGFGSRPYTNTTGTNEWPVVGFSPRKAALTIYGVFDGYGPPDPLFDSLGPHKTGKGCLYITRLDAVDPAVLEALVRQAWAVE